MLGHLLSSYRCVFFRIRQNGRKTKKQERGDKIKFCFPFVTKLLHFCPTSVDAFLSKTKPDYVSCIYAFMSYSLISITSFNLVV